MWKWVDSLVPADISPLAAYAVDVQQHPYGNDQGHDAPAGPTLPKSVTFSPEVHQRALANLWCAADQAVQRLGQDVFCHLKNRKNWRAAMPARACLAAEAE